MHDAAAAPPWSRADGMLAALLALASLVLYAALGLRLAQGQYLDYYNLAFDFDPYRYHALLSLDTGERGNVKHPLVALLKPLAWPLLAAGVAPKQASVLVMAGFGAATVAVCFGFVRALGTGRAVAAALAGLFAVSGSQTFTAIIPEAYGPAGFGIAAVWLVAALRLAAPARHRIAAVGLAVFGFGITLTNVVQSAVAEAMVALRHRGLAGAVPALLRFGLAAGAVAALLLVAVWHDAILAALADPMAVLREMYWQRTKGERTGAGQVLLTLLGFTVVSPQFSVVEIPGGIRMLDFRAPDFGPVGLAAALLWYGFALAGAAGMLLRRETRVLALGLAAMLAANLVLHVDFQFRGSIYLYAAHTHFLVFALGCGLAPWVRARPAARRFYLAAVLLLAGLVGGVTLARALEFVPAFDDVRVDCIAPCDT